MASFFDDLGREVEREWIRSNVREVDFSKICADVLARRPPSEEVSLDDVIAQGLGPERLVRQLNADSEFGQPAITVFANEQFLISVLFWLEGTTNIHEHAFSGAFHVLHGQSLNTTFSFEEQRAVNEHLKLGILRENSPELLHRGAIREIRSEGGLVHSGGATIHSLFHLAHPSATVLVRTYRASVARPQYTYWRPGIACNIDCDRKELKTEGTMMSLVYRTSPERFPEFVHGWLVNTDFTSGFLGLLRCLSIASPEEGDELLARVDRTMRSSRATRARLFAANRS